MPRTTSSLLLIAFLASASVGAAWAQSGGGGGGGGGGSGGSGGSGGASASSTGGGASGATQALGRPVRQAPGWPALPQALGRQDLQTRLAVHRPAWAIPAIRPRPHVARRLPGRTLPERPNQRVAARQEGPAAGGSTESNTRSF